MISDEEIDQALLANIADKWRKVAYVVGATMMQIEGKRRVGLDDLYFAKRIVVLVENGFIEYNGDLNQIRQCEIRLSPL